MSNGIDIIIPTKSKTDYLFDCLASIVKTTVDTPYHVYVCDTGSSEKELADIQRFLKDTFSKTKNATLLKFNYYNFAKINNIVVEKYSKNPILLFCNNDIKIVDNCIDIMQLYIDNDVGTIGCRLIFKSGNVQHAGQAVRVIEKEQGDLYQVTHRGYGTFNKYEDGEDVLGNTAGFMMVEKQLFTECGMFNENYKECFEDVELNLKVLLSGRRNVYIDSVKAYHHESITRGDNVQQMQRQTDDYVYRLTPFFDSLSKEQLSTILKFKDSK